MSEETDNSGQLLTAYIAANSAFIARQAVMADLHKRTTTLAARLKPDGSIGDPTIYNLQTMRPALDGLPTEAEIVAAIDQWIVARAAVRSAYLAVPPDMRKHVVAPPRAVGV